CGWNRDDANRKAEEKFRIGESTSDAGGCYLTTACTVAEGLPDDCYQLQVLREVRNNTLMRDSEGRRLVASYYALDPKIVGAINKRRDAREIWGNVCTDINVAASLAMSGMSQEAIKHYEWMTSRLAESYLN
ncbi:MAG: CFI-box-CTERM domain-containing protein, partial [Candidatus Aenigmatarchaeota archaeon]